mmetsp:Transcript_5289/g.14509  ORF Transcript_5289/g.14509 Transcript_5289/m.14509 type:complete len:652 (+) Transcript_5289:216-2171(+)
MTAAPSPSRPALGNVLLLEHINLNTQHPEAALTFYLRGLGLAQDPRMGEVVDGKVYVNRTMWLNAGLSQLHMPITTRGASGPRDNVLRGTIHVDVPSLSKARARLEALVGAAELSGTCFSYQAFDDMHVPAAQDQDQEANEEGRAHIVAIDPSGNRLVLRERPASSRDERCYHPGPLSWCLGVPAVEFTCPQGSSEGIKNFYEHYFNAAASAANGVATVCTGPHQRLRFVEVAGLSVDASVPYHERRDGIHLCLYIQDHARTLALLEADGLLWGNPRYRDLDRGLGTRQFRCKDIVDPRAPAGERGRAVLLELEHEVRTVDHAGSPFAHCKPYLLLDRPVVEARLVHEVSTLFEQDFEALRVAKMAVPVGWVPSAPRPGQEELVLFTWSTPNGVKASVCLEELALPYRLVSVHIGEGEQHAPGFHAISPADKIPALVDPNVRDPATGEPLTIFESGAILMHLAAHYGGGRLLGGWTAQERSRCLQWLFFQVGNFGPNAGQLHHFLSAAGLNPAPVTASQTHKSSSSAAMAERSTCAPPPPSTHDDYALRRFDKETRRLYGVLDERLASSEYLAGANFSIADIAVLGWVWRHPKHKVDIATRFPHVHRWWTLVSARPGVARGLALPTDEQKQRPRTCQLPPYAQDVFSPSLG